jgi:uracil-DNA glycosylase
VAPATDIPKSLGDPTARKERLAAIREEHVAPLNDFVDKVRSEKGLASEIPYFDPADGGCQARCLFLLEAPGPKAVASGFVSRNNPDETAKNFFLLNREAKLDRRWTVSWNIVPWYIGNNRKIRPASPADIAAGMPYLRVLLSLLPKLRVVVLMGRKAQRARSVVQEMTPSSTILDMLHPSPLVINHDPANRQEMLQTLKAVEHLLAQGHDIPDA